MRTRSVGYVSVSICVALAAFNGCGGADPLGRHAISGTVNLDGAPLGDGNITWTMVVTNNGPSADTGVKISDPMPAGNTFVSATTTKGTCTGGAILTCDIGPKPAVEDVLPRPNVRPEKKN